MSRLYNYNCQETRRSPSPIYRIDSFETSAEHQHQLEISHPVNNDRVESLYTVTEDTAGTCTATFRERDPNGIPPVNGFETSTEHQSELEKEIESWHTVKEDSAVGGTGTGACIAKLELGDCDRNASGAGKPPVNGELRVHPTGRSLQVQNASARRTLKSCLRTPTLQFPLHEYKPPENKLKHQAQAVPTYIEWSMRSRFELGDTTPEAENDDEEEEQPDHLGELDKGEYIRQWVMDQQIASERRVVLRQVLSPD